MLLKKNYKIERPKLAKIKMRVEHLNKKLPSFLSSNQIISPTFAKYWGGREGGGWRGRGRWCLPLWLLPCHGFEGPSQINSNSRV